MEHNKTVCFEFKRMHHILIRYVHAKMSENGVDDVAVTNGRILGHLFHNRDKVIYQRDLEETFGLARSTVANMVKELEQQGYITRETDNADARFKRVILTEKGEALQREGMRFIDRLLDELEDGITEEEKRTFYAVTDKLENNIRKRAGSREDEIFEFPPFHNRK